MPFDSFGVYTPAAGATTAAAGDTIHSATWNAVHTDFSNALTTVRQQPDYIDVERYGAIGDGLDSSASVNAQAFADAAAALGSNGGKILIPYGRFHTNGPFVNLLNKNGIEFVGVGSGNGQTGTIGSSEIVYTATSGPLIRLDGTQAILFKNLTLTYKSASYVPNNILIDIGQVSGSRNTSFTTFEECGISGWNSSAKNAILMDVANSYDTVILRGYWRNARFGIVGARQADQSDFCNAVTIDGVLFDKDITVPIIVGGNNWRLLNLIGEPTSGTTGGAAINFVMASPWGVRGLLISGCSFEDGGDNTGSWVNLKLATDYGAQGAVQALTVIGNLFECGSSASGGFAIDFGANGVSGGIISGNVLTRTNNLGFIADGGDGNDLLVMGNHTNTSGGPGVGKIFVAVLPTDSLVENNTGNGLQTTGRFQIAPSSTTRSGLNLGASGVAPTSPTNGDMWFDGTNVKVRVGGVTKTFTLT